MAIPVKRRSIDGLLQHSLGAEDQSRRGTGLAVVFAPSKVLTRQEASTATDDLDTAAYPSSSPPADMAALHWIIRGLSQTRLSHHLADCQRSRSLILDMIGHALQIRGHLISLVCLYNALSS